MQDKDARVLSAGERLHNAKAAALLVHGRGASAEDILFSTQPLLEPGWTFLAPQAPEGAWYPYPFTAPLEQNEPWLSSALQVLSGLLAMTREHVPIERTLLLGFSQGACLTLEYVARNARRYGAVVGWSGGLIGPDGTPRDYAGSLDGTPGFLGCSDVDPYIAVHRVTEAAAVLTRLGGEVDTRIYPEMGHEVNADELARVRELMQAIERQTEVGEAARRP
jgi:predicted esterase